MYRYSEYIRVRIVDRFCFIINIRDNTLFQIEASAFYYLDNQIKSSLTLRKLQCLPMEFIQFVHALEQKGILEITYESC